MPVFALIFFTYLPKAKFWKTFYLFKFFHNFHLSESNWVSVKTELWWLIPFNASEQFLNDIHDQNSEWVIVVSCQLGNFSAISITWREQVNFHWDDDGILFVLDQCGKPFFSNTRQNGEWTETSTRQNEMELTMFGEWHLF